MIAKQRHKVLVVEDDPDARKLICVILERDGNEVDEAVDGQAALEKLATTRYALVVLDIMLPMHNGFEVYDHILTLDPPPRVIVISAIARYVGDRFGEDIIVLQKPFLHEQLIDAIQRSLPQSA